jgi:hypothetical protein
MTLKCRALVWSALALQLTCLFASANTSVHTSWMWHMHQPIYWPDRAPANHAGDHYQNAYDTIQLKANGSLVPSDDLAGTFGDVNRLNDYTLFPHDAVQNILNLPNAGGQLNYSGALMEDVASLGSHAWNGYPSNWNSYNQQAHGWTTSSLKPRIDLTNFTYHHCIAPFVSDETLEMEILIHQRQQQLFWGNGSGAQISQGFFPAETCFSERIIPVLNKLGIAWSVISGSHLARACSDYPFMSGSPENMEIPNKADQLNPAQGTGNYWTTSIDRGCSPSTVAPFGYQLHYARYVNPSSGVASTIIVVPSDQALGWKDSYSTWDVGLISPIASRNNPANPSFLLLAHDGDNAWADGYSYWGVGQAVDTFANTVASSGYEPTTVEQFLSDFPRNTNDIVHVEDGGWSYADQDFGSPIMINWLWPGTVTVGGRNVVDPSAAVSDKADEWRTIVATENRVTTAQQIQNTLTGYTNRIDQIRDPWSFNQTPSAVELGWHYYLGSLDSGFVYYGCAGTHCASAVVAQSNAVRNVDSILNANPTLDTTPPTVFIPQRSPWNPGGANFGPEYQLNGNWNAPAATNTDFWVWTYAYDVSGVANATLFYRSNGSNNPPTQDEFKTYAGGPDTGSWVQQSLTKRVVASVLSANPEYIADYYYTKVTGLADTYVDYYVSATDGQGNTYNSPIQHVYVSPTPTGGGGGGGGSTNGCNGRVCVSPAPPVAGSPVTITFTPAGGPLASASQVDIHLGWNNWSTVLSPDAAMTSVSNTWVYSTTVAGTATELDCVFNNGAGTWDNNSSQDWKFAVTAGAPPSPPPTPTNVTAIAVSSSEIDLGWPTTSNTVGYVVYRSGAQIGTTVTATFSDLGLLANTLYCYTVASSNSAGVSAQSFPVCATTFTNSLPNPPPTPTNVTATALTTNQISVAWSSSACATSYIVARGGIPIATVATTSYVNSDLTPNTTYCYTIAATNSAGASAFSSSSCATTFAGPLPAFVLNGSASNYPGYLLSSPGMTLYAAIRGTVLYVATWSPGNYPTSNTNNDHFVLVSDQVLGSPTTSAPWGKAGTVAIPSTKVMLCGESQGTFVGWQTITGSSVSVSNQSMKASTNAGQIQGTIDLVQAFGSMPSMLYFCAAAYTTTNGGGLVAQAPAGNGNGNIESNEFLAVPVASIRDSTADGVLDNLDPNLGFHVQNAQPSGGSGCTITWVAVPGKSYQVMYSDSLAGGWTNLPNALVTAGSGQTSLSFADTSATNGIQRFYKIHSSY